MEDAAIRNLHLYLERGALCDAAAPLVEDRGRVLRYGEAYGRASALADALERRGVRPGDRVLLYMENSAEYVVAYFALLEIGAIVVPLHGSMDVQSIEHIRDDCGAALLLSTPAKAAFLARHGIDGRIDTWALTLEDLPMGPARPFRTVPPDHIALLLYTSGTSGRPKGVMLSHRNLCANTASILAYLPIQRGDRLLVTLSFGYSYGNSLLLTHVARGGALSLCHEAAFPQRVLSLLGAQPYSGFSTVGSYLHLLLRQDNVSAESFRHLRYMTFAGESSAPEDLCALQALCPHLKLFVMYGQTEAGARLSYLPPEKLAAKPASVGRPIPGVRIRIVDDEGREAGVGQVGELVASGENIMGGYWNDPEATSEKLRDGWLHTGDMAYRDAQGDLYIVGRRNDLIKVMGHRISPLEIEGHINRCDNVLESAVVEVRAPGEPARMQAFVVRKDPALPAGDIASTLRRGLPLYKVPERFTVIDALPKTSSGKIRRSALRDAASAGGERA